MAKLLREDYANVQGAAVNRSRNERERQIRKKVPYGEACLWFSLTVLFGLFFGTLFVGVICHEGAGTPHWICNAVFLTPTVSSIYLAGRVAPTIIEGEK